MSFGSLGISLSGIWSGITRLNVSADNTARHNVDGSEKNRVINEANEHGGTSTKIQKVPLESFPGAGQSTTSADQEEITTNIDYGEEAIAQTIADLSTRANIRVLEAKNDIDRHILDIKA